MKTSVKEAGSAEIIHDICHYEDPDTSLLINTTEEGDVFVSDQEWRYAVTAPTMRKALIKYQLKLWEGLDYSRSQARRNADEFFKLDWSTVICKIKEKTPGGGQTH